MKYSAVVMVPSRSARNGIPFVAALTLLPRVWLFTSRLGNSPVTRSKPIWLDVTIVTP